MFIGAFFYYYSCSWFLCFCHSLLCIAVFFCHLLVHFLLVIDIRVSRALVAHYYALLSFLSLIGAFFHYYSCLCYICYGCWLVCECHCVQTSDKFLACHCLSPSREVNRLTMWCTGPISWRRGNIGVQACSSFARLFSTPTTAQFMNSKNIITSKQLLINFTLTFGSLNFGMIIVDYFLVAPKFIQSCILELKNWVSALPDGSRWFGARTFTGRTWWWQCDCCVGRYAARQSSKCLIVAQRRASGCLTIWWNRLRRLQLVMMV